LVRYGGAYATPVPPPDDEAGTPALAAADGAGERIEEIMDRVHQAGDNQVERVAALEEYPALARAHEGETWFDAGAWSEDLADSYLALGRVGDAVRAIGDATSSGHAEGAEVLCELAEKLMRRGTSPKPGPCGSGLTPATWGTSGSMCRLASGTAISATTPQPWNG
jgi:hypothetical protein